VSTIERALQKQNNNLGQAAKTVEQSATTEQCERFINIDINMLAENNMITNRSERSRIK